MQTAPGETVQDSLARAFDPAVTFQDLAWLRERWQGTLVVKGVMRVDDAREIVQVEVPDQSVECQRRWLEREHATSRTDPLSEQHGVRADIRPDIDAILKGARAQEKDKAAGDAVKKQ